MRLQNTQGSIREGAGSGVAKERWEKWVVIRFGSRIKGWRNGAGPKPLTKRNKIISSSFFMHIELSKPHPFCFRNASSFLFPNKNIYKLQKWGTYEALRH